MYDVIFVGKTDAAQSYRIAGITSFEPAPRYLAERVLAERKRCRVIAMTADTLAGLPTWLAAELREGPCPVLAIVSAARGPEEALRIAQQLHALVPEALSTAA